jgi:hypothetical protein
MYLFTRSARLAPGNPQRMMTWALQMTEKVNQVTELNLRLWSTVFSPGVGTLVWTSRVEDLAVLEASDAKLMVDAGYLSLAEEGAKFASGEGVNDRLVRLLLADPDAANTDPQYATVVQAVLAPGGSERGIELGADIAQRAKRITGRPTSFGVATTGVYGSVEWITVYDSIAQLQSAEQAIGADIEFARHIDKEASKVYLTGTTQTVFRRLV